MERDFIVEDGRIFWDATTPIPSLEGPTPVRRWPAITMHDPETLDAIERFDLPPWPDNFGDVNGPEANCILRENRTYIVQFTICFHWSPDGR